MIIKFRTTKKKERKKERKKEKAKKRKKEKKKKKSALFAKQWPTPTRVELAIF